MRSEWGEAVYTCAEGDLPRGMVFVPDGPPDAPLMGGDTAGTGMPSQKNWEVDVEPMADRPASGRVGDGQRRSVAKMDKPEAPAQEREQSQHPDAAADTPSRSEEVLAWEHIGDDLWLPRRVRGSFHGGALG